ncbi:hypothetical protein SAMN05192553_102861 [Cyclobacterium xiamenense]|uniref:Lipocalin-like domain-containing protein n=1 Tax=Cyclobacterium xiamenense TaxID=1297121 RepID=A0A1H6WW81_9BACT|nr:hypothetical protein [Cyclobacterium xiamenense]SEJ19564.1 hypothetical protein SAMN05192553_102861 [Cyclobacterium xiamenense]
MKRLLPLSIFSLMVLFGCDPAEETPEQPKLSGGVWNLEAASVQASGSAMLPGSPVAIPVSLTGTGEQYQMSVTFGEDPKSVEAEGGFVFLVEASAAGIPVRSERFPIQGNERFTGNWELKDGQLLMEDLDDSFVMDVLEFTPNRLRVATVPDASDFEEFDFEGVTVGEARAEFLLTR